MSGGVRRGLRAIAPAKINWTLEVLRKRPDGYHELRSVVQTIDLHDVITLSEGDGIELEVGGPAAGALPDAPVETNLAYRAAVALQRRAGTRRGVRISIEKRIPVAAGLGGGSSDAAAVLRGLDRLWDLSESADNLAELAGEIGSDPPFFVYGGTAMISGRGERVEPLRDAVVGPILLATPPQDERGEKTAAMFAALTTSMYTEGEATLGLRETIEAGHAVAIDATCNVFEGVTATMQPHTELAMDALRALGHEPRLCGAGPSFYLLPYDDALSALRERVRELGFEPRPVRLMSRGAALQIRPPTRAL